MISSSPGRMPASRDLLFNLRTCNCHSVQNYFPFVIHRRVVNSLFFPLSFPICSSFCFTPLLSIRLFLLSLSLFVFFLQIHPIVQSRSSRPVIPSISRLFIVFAGSCRVVLHPCLCVFILGLPTRSTARPPRRLLPIKDELVFILI